MTPMTPFTRLTRRALDRQLAEAHALRRMVRPDPGWLRPIREALGMTASEWARRLHVAPSTVAEIERRERDGTITLNSLERAAAALGCRLVYAVVPETTLEQQVSEQAITVAERLVGDVEHSMALEDQATTEQARADRVAELAAELLRRDDRRLWSAP